MNSDERCVAMVVAGVLFFAWQCGSFINDDSKYDKDHAERMMMLDLQRDSTPIVESCIKHPAGRKVIVQ